MSGSPEIILNVDDTEAIRYAKTRTLRRAGFTVIEAGTGAEALMRVAEGLPALALLDVKLPDISGLEVCKAIKRDFPGTLVLQTSASFVETSDRIRGLESGADSYLTEPVEPSELVAAVRALLRLRRAEDELRRLNATLEERVRVRTAELAAANERLRAEMEERRRAEEALRQSHKMEAIGQLTGGLAHDFNNLLTGIVGGLGLLKTRIEQGRTSEVDRYIDAAITSAGRAAGLTHRLLAFARRQPLAPKPVDVNELVASMEELACRTIGPAIEMETVLAADLWPAYCDVNQLESALLNLLINARDAMPGGGRLTIETENLHFAGSDAAAEHEMSVGDYVGLSVTDTGVGMPPDVVARAFDPFFTTKPIGQGTGLGLSQIYGFVKQSGGHSRIVSEVGRGTTVRIYLPRHVGRRDSTTPTASIATGESLAGADAGTTVLLVEDETIVRMLIVEALKEMGCLVLEAGNGPAGLSLLQSDTRVDLLITDMGLPGGLTGRQVAAAARQYRPGLKVLFITGYSESAAIGSFSLEPGMGLMTKPFTMETLVPRIRALLKKGE
ncbi:response regulator [Falsiroseomonas sp. HW251]|uniref:response regulator n=1 Tax=Falsiroseomonas sp. HW251 TaxID=3390998 RepID=UPI003D31396A